MDTAHYVLSAIIGLSDTVQPRLSEPSIIRTRHPKKMQGQSTHCDHVTQLRMRSKPTSRSCHARTSLVPRPHPRGGKGSGELGQNPWACAEEFPRANEIVALAQSYDKLTAGMQHRYTVCIAIDNRGGRRDWKRAYSSIVTSRNKLVTLDTPLLARLYMLA